MKIRLVLILAAALASCRSATRTDVPKNHPSAPSPAPDFEMRALDGSAIRLKDYRGKTVLLDFWATWCEPCKQSIPRYIAMQDRLRSKGFTVLGVDEGEEPGLVSGYARKLGIDYPVVIDADAKLFHSYRGTGLPAAFLIDADGNIRGTWNGFDAATGLDVEAATDRLLGDKPKL
jgi:thiol-disulfide isomerase/thioredoxin